MITFNNMGKVGFGRLGNQMFQYALVFSVSKKLCVEFGVPYKNKSQNEFGSFCLDDGFEIRAKDSSDFTPNHHFKEKSFNFDPSVFLVNDNTDFEGFFQSEKYFKEFEKEIRKEFLFKEEIIKSSNKLISKFDPPLISICIRRGDYLNYKKIHPTCNSRYFFDCLKKLPNYTKLIFTDDENWAKYIFSSTPNSTIIKQENNKENKFVILRSMSLCQYHILSNSSFCWWASWLCEKENKKIFAPSVWFGDSWNNGNCKDLYLDEWEIVDNKKSIKL